MTDDPKDWEVATRLVRGGTARSPYGETAEALYLTQSFIYETAEAADARFAGNDPGYIYSRYGNPTVTMFQDRMARPGRTSDDAPVVVMGGRVAHDVARTFFEAIDRNGFGVGCEEAKRGERGESDKKHRRS